jgi:hypothetical protein
MLLTDLKRDINNSFGIPKENLKPIDEYVENLLTELIYKDKVPLQETIDVIKYANIEKTAEQNEYVKQKLFDLLEPIVQDVRKCKCYNKTEDPI